MHRVLGTAVPREQEKYLHLAQWKSWMAWEPQNGPREKEYSDGGRYQQPHSPTWSWERRGACAAVQPAVRRSPASAPASAGDTCSHHRNIKYASIPYIPKGRWSYMALPRVCPQMCFCLLTLLHFLCKSGAIAVTWRLSPGAHSPLLSYLDQNCAGYINLIWGERD